MEKKAGRGSYGNPPLLALPPRTRYHRRMSKTEILVLWLLNLLAGVGAVLWLRHYFAPAAREQRRRARSHGRVVSKARHPMVRLAVQTEERKRER